ncbi:MAG TPA: alanine racemase [Pyrinomonadaceae bacterium]|jgi:D-serine deaminase-like pyridoxal phosphate-dependent protein
MQLETIKTPSLIVDFQRMNRNAESVSDRAKSLNVRLRPHVKTHRCAEIARLQTENNFGGIMVSTLAEAHFFARNGFSDIVYGVPVERGKFAEVIEIAKAIEKFAVLTDDAATVEELNQKAKSENTKLDVFLKVDVGSHRCGVEPGTREAFEIPQKISDSSNLDFAGILTHAGHAYHAGTPEKLLAVAQEERNKMRELAGELRAKGLEVPTVSIGSTPTMSAIDSLEGVTELRCGNYIFYDAFQATLGSCAFDDCALTVLAAVVHRDATRQKIVVDAGAVALSKDRGAVKFDSNCGYGRVYDLEGNDLNLRVGSLSQEHGEIFVDDEGIFNQLKVGSRLRILANHSCLTALQHSHYHILDDREIVDRWEINRGW